MKKKLTAMLLAAGAMLGAWADLGGSGTKAAPYRIGNYADLVAFAAKVNGEGKFAAGVFVNFPPKADKFAGYSDSVNLQWTGSKFEPREMD